MPKTITVKGIGRATAKPDLIVLSMKLETENMKYDEAMHSASLRIQHLKETLMALGYDKKDLKTTDFNVSTNYESEKDKYGNYHSVFKGYRIRQNLKLEFAFNQERLSTALNAVSGCISKPEFQIRFTIKDNTAINEEMLRSAAENAKRKAEILCDASGTKLGDLISINYSWGELDIYSDTRYDLAEDCVREAPMAYDIEPDDIDVSDTVTFVWEIV